MPSDWKKLAQTMAKVHLPDTNPYFWLKDETFRRVGSQTENYTATQKIQKPHWLSPTEQDDCLRDGITVCICQNPETKLFGAVTEEEAHKFNLNIKRKM